MRLNPPEYHRRHTASHRLDRADDGVRGRTERPRDLQDKPDHKDQTVETADTRNISSEKLGISALCQGLKSFSTTTRYLDSNILGELSGVLDCGHHVTIENLQGDPALPITRVHPRVQGDHHVEVRYNVQSLSAEPHRGGPFHLVAINQRAA